MLSSLATPDMPQRDALPYVSLLEQRRAPLKHMSLCLIYLSLLPSTRSDMLSNKQDLSCNALKIDACSAKANGQAHVCPSEEGPGQMPLGESLSFLCNISTNGKSCHCQ